MEKEISITADSFCATEYMEAQKKANEERYILLNIKTLAVIMELIKQARGNLNGITRLHKLCYIAKHIGVEELKDADFEMHMYGPFSKHVERSIIMGSYNKYLSIYNRTVGRYGSFIEECYGFGENKFESFSLSEESSNTVRRIYESVGNIKLDYLKQVATILYCKNNYDGMDTMLKAIRKMEEIKNTDYCMEVHKALFYLGFYVPENPYDIMFDRV